MSGFPVRNIKRMRAMCRVLAGRDPALQGRAVRAPAGGEQK